MRISVVVAFAALLTIGVAIEAAAQRIPSGAPQVDLGAPNNRGLAGRDVPWSGPPNYNPQPGNGGGMYFEPTRRPFQGSEARRWQRKLNRVWGGVPYDRNVPRVERRYGFPTVPQERIFVAPQPWPIINCFGNRCQRTFPPIR